MIKWIVENAYKEGCEFIVDTYLQHNKGKTIMGGEKKKKKQAGRGGQQLGKLGLLDATLASTK